MTKDKYWFVDKSKSVEKINMGYLYVLRFESWFKIGITNNLYTRFNSFRFSLPTNNFEMYGFTACEKNGRLENGILNDLIQYKTRGEWVCCSEDELLEVINHWMDVFNIEFHAKLEKK